MKKFIPESVIHTAVNPKKRRRLFFGLTWSHRAFTPLKSHSAIGISWNGHLPDSLFPSVSVILAFCFRNRPADVVAHCSDSSLEAGHLSSSINTISNGTLRSKVSNTTKVHLMLTILN
ncbi:MAG: hypothetical protein WAO52_03575 [Prolixibacteraceae bacterium]|jgi:hypothetical protein